MKRKVLIFITALVVCYSCKEKQTPAPVKDNSAAAKAMLLSFYTEYITQCGSQEFDMEKWEVLIRKHCTNDLAQKILETELAADPFLSAQDCDAASVKTLTVTQDAKEKDKYEVCYTWPSDNKKICTPLTLIETSEGFRISEVELDKL